MRLGRLFSLAATLAAFGGAAADCQLGNSLSAPTAGPETRTALCLPQGEGAWTFAMDIKLNNFPSPSLDDPLAGLVGSHFFVIYDHNCIARGVYSPEGNMCGKPYVIQDYFLPWTITVTDISWALGDGYFRFQYANGLYSIGNNQCTCQNISEGLTGEQACKCAFPINGEQ